MINVANKMYTLSEIRKLYPINNNIPKSIEAKERIREFVKRMNKWQRINKQLNDETLLANELLNDEGKEWWE